MILLAMWIFISQGVIAGRASDGKSRHESSSKAKSRPGLPDALKELVL
jgi:hypothetical protein